MAYQEQYTDEELAMQALEQQRESEMAGEDYSIDTYQTEQPNVQQETESFEEPELSTEESLEQAGTEANATEYTNTFAKLFGKVADFVGPDSSVGKMIKSVADRLEYNYGTANVQEIQKDMVAGDDKDMRSALDAADGTATNTDGQTESEQKSEYGELGKEYPGSDDYQGPTDKYTARTAQVEAAYQEDAKEAMETDDFVNMAENKDSSFSELDRNMRQVHRGLSQETMATLGGVDKTAEMKKDVSEKYMNVVRGLSAYDQTAQEEIQTKYANDPERLQQAQQGLSNMMGRTMTQAYGMVAEDNQTWDFLSKENIAELDSLKVSGMDKTFSEYRKEAGFEDSIVKTTQELQGVNPAQGSVNMPTQVDSRMMKSGVQNVNTTSTSKNRGAEAESKFDTILQNEKASREQSLTAGLER